MLLDWRAGRPLETAVIVHAPLRAAAAAGVPMPRLHTIACLLAALVRCRLPPGKLLMKGR